MASILVVDDEAHTRVYLGTVLGYQERHDVVSATDGVVGVWAFERTRPDLVIVDLEMPYLDGIHMIEHLATEHPSSRIIAMSGQAMRLEQAKRAGAQASLRKPFDRTELLATIDGVFAARVDTAADSPAPRRVVRSPVELTLERSSVPVVAESRNLSRTGMLVFSEGPKPAGTSLRFRFSDFGGRATTIWAREEPGGSLLGVRFATLGRRDRAALNRLLGVGSLLN